MIRSTKGVTIASRDADAALAAQELFQTDYFRVYTNHDVAGVELAGRRLGMVRQALHLADSGYHSEDTLRQLHDLGIDALIADTGFRSRDPRFAQAPAVF